MGKEGWQDGPTLDKLLTWQEATLRPSAFNGTMSCRGKDCHRGACYHLLGASVAMTVEDH